jgi:pantoate--beta-alanine ligase
MQLFRELEAFRRACDEARSRGQRVGLVPTMGALHAGHIALITEAKQRTDFIAVSIFVNPTQFGPSEDLSRYPRDMDRDMEKCAAAGAALVFAPSVEAMYPKGEETRVRVGATAAPLCGAHRPGHFEGVATIVTKLFVLTGPCTAVFGRKDYQQLQVIKRLTQDLLLPIEIVGVRTVREPDGLAMSSRNAYLSAEQRQKALAIPRGLAAAARAFAEGERRAGVLAFKVTAEVAKVADAIDYVSVADPESLRVFGPEQAAGDRALCALAVRLGGARLIDNLVLGQDPEPAVSA